MLNSQDIRSIINEVVIGIDANAIASSTKFQEFGLDSLDHANILLAIEEQHGLKVPDEALEECSSIDGILAYAQKNSS